ncbi:hypothetical protein [Noviherbaspirillum denitrificans]|uniref:Uncharacterized protein n=1 Tax=Noviherbaspirillum denitrificans TaxID=1968433 RepID=A0A254TG69_9BURK|nr:hypothetical protein [Noviherbaspirillum denitrificans]OWW18668.1 hypothetical protein AYR66_03580 [Noviherbaspirillum denitrificans]
MKNTDSLSGRTDAKYALVPADFPLPVHLCSGSDKKPISSFFTKYKEQLYAPGCSPCELYTRWDACEDLALKLAKKAFEAKQKELAHLSEQNVLELFMPGILATGWTSTADAKWVLLRIAAILRWSPPHALIND